MKVDKRVLDVDTNLQGEHVGMTIDDGALAHIMSVLTDLYSDPELAVIREYSTNALDAHRDAGVKRPIEVTLPTPLSPFFRVRDYGAGLDADDIRNIYSRYGTSTKRESNDVVGMLGLGCKSALTYTDQFTVTGYKNGRMIQVAVSRDEDGSGSMTIVADQPVTSGETGVEVIVPAKRHNAFESKADEFFRFWAHGDVLVNGEHPERIDGLWIDDNLLLTDEVRYDHIVMGNVAYPVPNEDRYLHSWGHRNAVAFVDIGAVQFTPSREALQMTKLTKATLERVKAEIQTKLNASITKQIADAPTAREAIRLLSEGLAAGYTGKATYKGRPVAVSLKRAPRADRDGHFLLYDGGYYSRRKTGEWRNEVPLTRSHYQSVAYTDGAWFVGFDAAELSSYKRQKLDVYWSTRGTAPHRQIFVDALTPDERFWLEGVTIHQWADVEAIKITKDNAALVSGRPRGAYVACVDGKWTDKVLADTIDTSKPIVYMQGNKWEMAADRAYRISADDDATFVPLPANRVEKFKRDFPQAKEVQDYAREKATTWAKGIDPFRLEAGRAQNSGLYNVISGLDADRVKDPTLVRNIKLARASVSDVIAKLDAYERWLPQHATASPITDYPLLAAYGRGYSKPDKEHAIIYVNAAYAAKEDA